MQGILENLKVMLVQKFIIRVNVQTLISCYVNDVTLTELNLKGYVISYKHSDKKMML